MERLLSDLAISPNTRPRVLNAKISRDALSTDPHPRPPYAFRARLPRSPRPTTTNERSRRSLHRLAGIERTRPPSSAELEWEPLYLLYLLCARGTHGTVVFVKSNEPAVSLSTLLEIFFHMISEGWTVKLLAGGGYGGEEGGAGADQVQDRQG